MHRSFTVPVLMTEHACTGPAIKIRLKQEIPVSKKPPSLCAANEGGTIPCQALISNQKILDDLGPLFCVLTYKPATRLMAFFFLTN